MNIAALDETDYWSELQEGKIFVSPSPLTDHSMATLELHVHVREQLPADLVALSDIDVDLELVPEDRPVPSKA